MNRLDELPLAQKLMLVVLSLAFVGAAAYFLLIGDVEDVIVGKQAEVKRLSEEAERLSPYKSKEKTDALIAEESAEIARIEQNRRMLPSRDELPGFIDSVKSDADAVGLQILKFDIGETELEDYYAQIPIQVKAIGTYPTLVAFLRTLAAPTKRISNVRGFDVQRVIPDVNRVLALLGDNDLTRKLSALRLRRESSKPEYSKLVSILEMEAMNSLGLMSATFTVYAFSYTGKLAPEDAKKKKRMRRGR